MTTALKRLWLALVTLALGAMSSGAMADTSYNFSYSGTASGVSDPANTFIVEGVFIVNGAGLITNILNGKVSGINPYSGNITGVIPVGASGFGDGNNGFGGNNNIYSSLAPYVTGSGVAFSTDAVNVNSNNQLNLYFGSGNANFPYALCGNGTNINKCGDVSIGTMTSSAAAVPEIDGALIPQVGLLLAGLFIILGRRKENTEPMLAV